MRTAITWNIKYCYVCNQISHQKLYTCVLKFSRIYKKKTKTTTCAANFESLVYITKQISALKICNFRATLVELYEQKE